MGDNLDDGSWRCKPGAYSTSPSKCPISGGWWDDTLVMNSAKSQRGVTTEAYGPAARSSRAWRGFLCLLRTAKKGMEKKQAIPPLIGSWHRHASTIPFCQNWNPIFVCSFVAFIISQTRRAAPCSNHVLSRWVYVDIINVDLTQTWIEHKSECRFCTRMCIYIVYICIYIYTYTHTYICVYIYIYVEDMRFIWWPQTLNSIPSPSIGWWE